jgi:hypothetical protein
MDPIALLRQQAVMTRNTAILKAKREYQASLKQIDALGVDLASSNLAGWRYWN